MLSPLFYFFCGTHLIDENCNIQGIHWLDKQKIREAWIRKVSITLRIPYKK